MFTPQGNQSMWSALSNVEPTQGKGDRIRAGFHIVEIKEVIWKQTRQYGMAFIAELSLLATNNPKMSTDKDYSIFMSTQKQDVFLRNIKAFALAVYGVDYSTAEGKQICESKFDPNWDAVMNAGFTGAWVGKRLAIWSEPAVSKNGNPYRKEIFQVVPPNQQEWPTPQGEILDIPEQALVAPAPAPQGFGGSFQPPAQGAPAGSFAPAQQWAPAQSAQQSPAQQQWAPAQSAQQKMPWEQ